MAHLFTEEYIFLKYHNQILKRPNPNWHFDSNELKAIVMIYYKLLRGATNDIKTDLPVTYFREVLYKSLGMVEDTLMKHIYSALGSITDSVPLKHWINTMSLFLRGTLEEKIKYCFDVYDTSGKNEIRYEDMVTLLRSCVFKHRDEEVEEIVKDFADIILKKLDYDKDGIITFADFNETVKNDPMMLECLGQCLPDVTHANAFLTTFTDKLNTSIF
ncbi:CLUMA_CG013135, isoform A [Clunio marinus]|uniref:CLUMA_CG013135, isoform A n=1 Tax=Clunio marinus TaxID=568069 RepID=A0A1J1IHY7_9DIPT|nr:CLUMA_CG013135, isoform A [Clunio marinus]